MGADYMGWTCANDEILTGFGLSADQHDVTKVRCCKAGGHSSIKSNTCTYVESNHERAKCGNGNDHMVFSGAYDKRVAVNDAVTEILAGKFAKSNAMPLGALEEIGVLTRTIAKSSLRRVLRRRSLFVQQEPS